MKKLLFTLLLAIIAFVPVQAECSVVTHGDTTMVVEDADTVYVVGLNALGSRITALLNDTLVDVRNFDTVEHDEMATAERISSAWSKTLAGIVAIITAGVIVIVVFSLLFRYLNRRRKYMMVEKAIENNYPLPSYIFGGVRETVRTVYVGASVPVAQATPPPLPAEAGAGGANAENVPAAQPASAPQQVRGRINWIALKGGFTLAAVGFGAFLFFAIAGAEPLAGACTVLILLGLGKMWIAYQDQKAFLEESGMHNG
ncbi:MAG: hypothetical protein IJT30_07525 [Muribaculaceae bacterium]|nr:hypothetical protein [Muribaculaceae bacterium]